MKTIYITTILLIIILCSNNIIEIQCQERIKNLFKNEINNKLNRKEEFLNGYQKLIEMVKGYDGKKIGYYDIFFSDAEINARNLISKEFIYQYKIFFRDVLDRDLNHLIDKDELLWFFKNIKRSDSYTENDIIQFIKKNSNDGKSIDLSTYLKACTLFHTDFTNSDTIWKFILNDVAINRTNEMDEIAQYALLRYQKMRREYNQAINDMSNEISSNLENFKKQYEQLTGNKLDD